MEEFSAQLDSWASYWYLFSSLFGRIGNEVEVLDTISVIIAYGMMNISILKSIPPVTFELESSSKRSEAPEQADSLGYITLSS